MDQWVCRFFEQRGAPFSTMASEYILSPISRRRTALPKFFKVSLQALKSLHIIPVERGRFTDADEARAEPIWCSHRHNPRVSHAWDWRKHLHTNRVNDLINHKTGLSWNREELRAWFDEHLQPCVPTAKRFFAWPRDITAPTPPTDRLTND